ncbi:MAG: alpha-amylase family glycosyl hydrolase [Chloroflexota bacterium]
MNETIFGSLATVEKRIAYMQEQTAGFTHHNQLQPLAPGPQDAPLLTATVALNRQIAQVECVLSAPKTAVLPLTPVKTEWDLLNWTYRQTWQVTLPQQPAGTLVRYRLRACPVDGSEPLWADDGATFSYLVDEVSLPAWAKDAIVYQIFPDRFAPGNGRSWNNVNHLSDIYGGTLRGIIEKLDYVADLGFNVIWLNPFFPDKTHHGYHATDHFSVNPRLGSMADIEELIAEAHKRGIRLLLDFVGNHVGSEHPYFQDALAHRDSPYHDWFRWRSWPDDYVAYYEVKELPELNTENAGVRDYMFRSVQFWLEKGFDGLRIDYTLGPSHDFWTMLRAAVRDCKPDAWMFGETVHTPQTQLSYDGRFHGNLDFLLAQKLRDTFAFNTMNVAEFDAFLHLHETFFPAHVSRPSFLDNHDMNRFLWIAKGDKRKLKLATLCHFTLTHPPVVYNGTEIGLSQERGIGDPDSHGMEECRLPMPWDALDTDMLAYYRQLTTCGGHTLSSGKGSGKRYTSMRQPVRMPTPCKTKTRRFLSPST